MTDVAAGSVKEPRGSVGKYLFLTVKERKGENLEAPIVTGPVQAAAHGPEQMGCKNVHRHKFRSYLLLTQNSFVKSASNFMSSF